MLQKNPQWSFVGLLPLFDPPRHDTKDTIARCLEKGISVKMVTGDQLLIGKEVARQLGMGTNMYTTEVLIKVRMGICLPCMRAWPTWPPAFCTSMQLAQAAAGDFACWHYWCSLHRCCSAANSCMPAVAFAAWQ